MFVIAVSSIAAIYALISIVQTVYDYKKSEKSYELVGEVYADMKDEERNNRKTNPLRQLNEDYVGWFIMDSVNIDYPVVKGKDNDHYLDHNFHGQEDAAGAIFMDYRNDRHSLDQNTIIYGHNMKDNSMFGRLSDYITKDAAQMNNTIQLDFQGEMMEWEVFSVYKTTNTEWMQVDFDSSEEYENYLTRAKRHSTVKFSSDIASDQSVLTLATCTTGNDEERIVMHAKLDNGGE